MTTLIKTRAFSALLLVGLMSFLAPLALGNANLDSSPARISPGDLVTLTVTSTDDGTCVGDITVTAPDGVTTWTYDYNEVLCTDVVTQELINGKLLNNGETDTKTFGPGGDFGDTTQDGRYQIVLSGTNGAGYFDASRSFIVPEFALPAIIAPSIAFAYFALRNRLRRK